MGEIITGIGESFIGIASIGVSIDTSTGGSVSIGESIGGSATGVSATGASNTGAGSGGVGSGGVGSGEVGCGASSIGGGVETSTGGAACSDESSSGIGIL